MRAAATGTDMPDHYLRAFIIKGLKSSIRQVVKQQNPQTLDGLQTVIKQAESAEVETEDTPTAAITALMAELKSLRSEQAEVKAIMAERPKSADQPVAATSVQPQQVQQPAQWQWQQPGMPVPWLPQQPAWQPPPYANPQPTAYPAVNNSLRLHSSSNNSSSNHFNSRLNSSLNSSIVPVFAVGVHITQARDAMH